MCTVLYLSPQQRNTFFTDNMKEGMKDSEMRWHSMNTELNKLFTELN